MGITFHYTGTFTEDGCKFDSSVDRGQPFVFRFGMGHVIRGWDEGLGLMSLGEQAVISFPADHGYGVNGMPGRIPPNTDLTFEVELLMINGKDLTFAKRRASLAAAEGASPGGSPS